MLRVLWVGGYFFGTLPFVILIQFVLGAVSTRLWEAVLCGYYQRESGSTANALVLRRDLA